MHFGQCVCTVHVGYAVPSADFACDAHTIICHATSRMSRPRDGGKINAELFTLTYGSLVRIPSASRNAHGTVSTTSKRPFTLSSHNRPWRKSGHTHSLHPTVHLSSSSTHLQVAQLIQDYEDDVEVNKQLEKMYGVPRITCT